MGNPSYQFIPFSENFEDECKENDLEGFKFIYPEDEIMIDANEEKDKKAEETEGTEVSEESEGTEGMEETEENGEAKDSEEILEKEEEEYQKNYPVKKWKFDYNRSTCFSDNYPEINYKEDNGGNISVAPGEGKFPSNILQERDWDFMQRIMNKDSRFACNPAYIFAAVAYIEKKQIEGRRGISYKRGKSSTLLNGTKSYSLDDPYSVLDNVKNTPRYWQKTRYELMA